MFVADSGLQVTDSYDPRLLLSVLYECACVYVRMYVCTSSMKHMGIQEDRGGYEAARTVL